MAKPIVVASSNARVGMQAAVDMLAEGGTATDAVIAATRLVEANPDDHSVGFSGLPNLLGEVELDASIMEGKGLRAGAVGALRGYQDAILAARAVMDRSAHSFIVGDGTRTLSAETGLPATDLLTEETRAIWLDGLRRVGISPEQLDDGKLLQRTLDAIAAESTAYQETMEKLYHPPVATGATEPPHGTVNILALDAAGNLASAVSTSGWAWKYPGRLGDSPVIGAGNYCDNRWGAAACTGRGEMAFRCATAHSVIMFLRFGYALEDAVVQALRDMDALDDPWASDVNIVALTPAGEHFAASTHANRTYVWQSPGMASYEEPIRREVPLSIIANRE